MRTEAEERDFVAGLDLGENKPSGLELKAEVEGSTWRIVASAPDTEPARHGSGWVATDTEGARYLAPFDKANENEPAAKKALDDLDQAFNENFEHPPETGSEWMAAAVEERTKTEAGLIGARTEKAMHYAGSPAARRLAWTYAEPTASSIRVTLAIAPGPYQSEPRLLEKADPKEVNPELKAAVSKAVFDGEIRILAFLIGIASGRDFGGIDVAVFSSEDPNEKRSWYSRSGGRTLNREWIKDQFRDAVPERGGQHEWIPSNLILEVVTGTTRPSGAEEGAKWVRLQHVLRAPTEFVIFKPDAKLDAHPINQEYAKWKKEPGGTARTFVQPPRKATDFVSLRGHVGSIYLTGKKEDGTARGVQQTRGQAGFHDRLRALYFDNSSNIRSYCAALRGFVFRECWDGNLDFLDKQLRGVADGIGNDYADAGGAAGRWGSNLAKMAAAVESGFLDIVDIISRNTPLPPVP